MKGKGIKMNEEYKKLEVYIEKSMAYRQALALFEWDAQTIAPDIAMENTAKTIGILSNEYFKNMVNDEVKQLIYHLSDPKNQEELDFNQKAIVKYLKKDFDRLEPIPAEEYQAYSELSAKAMGVWVKAKNNRCFSDFEATLEEIVGYQKKFAGYRAKEGQKLYDVHLSDYEEGFDMEKLDLFFEQVKAAIIPLVKQVKEKNNLIDKSFNSLEYDIAKQKEFCDFIAEYVGFDKKKGVIAESEHPFTMEMHNKDVRITNHFQKNNLESGIFSIIHESGHAIYEMDIDDAITQTPVGCGTSMGMHESQSRFYENIIGRSEAFWVPVYSKLVETFPQQLEEISLKDFVKSLNKSEPGLIRTEADELTYSLHVMIRYEIEKMIFAGELAISDLPKVWNEKYQEYLGLTPANDAEGVLQDMHWAAGNFGYFPSYALGSAISAQIYYFMLEKMPFEKYLSEGNLSPIQEFLRQNIHKYGATKITGDILFEMMNEGLNAEYFIRYLTEKYTKLYNL